VCGKELVVKPDACDQFGDQSLARRHALADAPSDCEQKLARFLAHDSQVVIDGLAGLAANTRRSMLPKVTRLGDLRRSTLSWVAG
jgi:hypothetical protein